MKESRTAGVEWRVSQRSSAPTKKQRPTPINSRHQHAYKSNKTIPQIPPCIKSGSRNEPLSNDRSFVYSSLNAQLFTNPQSKTNIPTPSTKKDKILQISCSTIFFGVKLTRYITNFSHLASERGIYDESISLL